MGTVLECKNLSKMYGGVPALADLSLAFPEGRIIGLLGPNGSGKTTFIKLAAGLLTPSGGELTIAGMPPGVETKTMVSYLPERPYFSSWMRVCDIFDVFSDFYGDFDRAKAREMLTRLGIEESSRIKTLSKGNKEKVQLILVMSRKARLYLLDEPIGGVDPATREYILDTIITNYSEQATVVISTHLIGDIEKVLDEFYFLSMGSVYWYGETDTVREQQGKSIDELFREVFRC